MIKNIIVIFLWGISCLSTALWANPTFLMEGGLELSGDHVLTYRSGVSENDVDSSAAFGFELMASSNDALNFGIGAMFQANRSIKQVDGDNSRKDAFNNLPLYAIIRFALPINKYFELGALGNLGINYLDGNKDYLSRKDLKIGSYMAAGLLLEFRKSVYTELVFRECNSSYEIETIDKTTVKIKTSNFALMFGYRFSIPIS